MRFVAQKTPPGRRMPTHLPCRGGLGERILRYAQNDALKVEYTLSRGEGGSEADGRGMREIRIIFFKISGFCKDILHAVPLPPSLRSVTFPPGEGIRGERVLRYAQNDREAINAECIMQNYGVAERRSEWQSPLKLAHTPISSPL